MSTQLISEKAIIGKNVTLGHSVRIYDNVVIGDNTSVGDFCILGHPARGEYAGKVLKIGNNSVIRSHTVMYEGSFFDEQLQVGHTSMIREGVVAGKNLQIGSFNDLEGDCVIGDYCRFHSNVHIGRGSKIGNLVWLFPYVVLTNDPLPPSGLKEGATLEDGTVVCTSSVVLPGTVIRKGAFIAAMTRVKGDVPAGALVVGGKGEIVGNISKLRHKGSNKQHPWMNHFAWAYPQDAQQMINDLGNDINKLLEQTSA